MNKLITTIGPADHGRPMSLEEFGEAEGQDGRVYELSRGIVTKVEVPNKRHMLLVAAIRDQLQSYKGLNPGIIQVIAAGNECKLVISALGSERHPDLAVYLTPPPEVEDERFWVRWVPELVIEVVSPRSRTRDYDEKPEEYLRAGVKEYWIVDGERRELTVLRRSRRRWINTTVSPPVIHRTRLLPGLHFSIAAILDAAGIS
jgi:Uma2 family endonuclease